MLLASNWQKLGVVPGCEEWRRVEELSRRDKTRLPSSKGLGLLLLLLSEFRPELLPDPSNQRGSKIGVGGKLISYFHAYFRPLFLRGVSVKYNFIMNVYYSNYSFIFSHTPECCRDDLGLCPTSTTTVCCVGRAGKELFIVCCGHIELDTTSQHCAVFGLVRGKTASWQHFRGTWRAATWQRTVFARNLC